MKKKILAIAVIVLCLSLLTGGTLAYFTTMDTATNVIVAGGLDVSIVEQQLVDGELLPYPEQPIEILPGTSVSKIVSTLSLEAPGWIRMNYTVTVLDPQGDQMDVSEEVLRSLILIEPDAALWTLRDGWWYYAEPVGAGESTEPLFEQVSFSPEMGNAYQRCTILIHVTAQAVQQVHNGESALEAAGWPELPQE